MSFFNFLQRPGSGSSTVKPLKLRREVVNGPRSLTPQSHGRAISGSQKTLPTKKSKTRSTARNLSVTPSQGKPSRKRACSEQVLKSSSEESDNNVETSSKRVKHQSLRNVDHNRHIRFEPAFDKKSTHVFPMVHAADITSLETNIKFVPAFPGLPDRAEVYLQYPSMSQQEKYYLVKPQYGHDDFEAIEDIVQMMRIVIKHYLPLKESAEFEDETSGYPQRLSRAVKRQSEDEVRTAVSDWNKALVSLRDQGIIAQVLDSTVHLEPQLVERILTQTYSRTVSPRVRTLRDYENGTDNVYGELLPKFISGILKKDTCITSKQVFVDLGSGVGNVVLQAALEVGCESWGCEMMPNACDLAELQQKEFEARCRLWGLSVGKICLERGDFLTNSAISKVLQRADVVLVNNQAFTPELNEGLTSLFLDLKEGCRIVSLKSFVPAGHKITARNLNSPYNVLAVHEKEYYSGCVSWTNAPGTYYVSTKDSRKIRAFSSRSSAPESL